MALKFDGQVALVTGAGTGLGKAYALWLARRGAAVVVNNRNREGRPSTAQEVVAEIRREGGRAVAAEYSVTDEEGARSTIEVPYREFGRLDILVCNAGILPPLKPFHETPLAEIRETICTNIFAAVYPVHAAIPRMLEASYGRVVLTISPVALFGRSGLGAYGCSKSALVGLARSLGHELSGRNVHINVIAPVAHTRMSTNKDPRLAELLSPIKVAPAVGWLCSSDCRQSGMIFSATGGRVRRAKIQEGAPMDMVNEEMSACWPALDDMNGAVEAKDSIESGATIFPERFRYSSQ